ncbi:hypothetical protein [Winogradskyella sp.]
MKKLLNLFCVVLLVACSSSDDSPQTEDELLEVATELIYFEYTPDTGNNTSKLEYQFRFTNPNAVMVTGGARITINSDGLESTTIGTDDSPCYVIEANSECIYTFEAESSHDLGIPNSVEFVSAYYNMITD